MQSASALGSNVLNQASAGIRDAPKGRQFTLFFGRFSEKANDTLGFR